MTSIIRFEHVSKRYRHQRQAPRSFRERFVAWLRRRPLSAGQWLPALDDVSFEIGRAETVGLIGPNGAGKSTALKLVSRVIEPSAGRVEVGGRVAALLELGTGFHPDLSGRDNVFLSGALIGMGRAEMLRKYDAILEFSELADFIDTPVKHYSSGMFARLAFAVSIHLEPDVLLVDEVLAVGDQSFQQKCLDRIAALQREGVTIFLVTHAADIVRALCTRALWFDHGRLQADGAAEAVVRHYLDHVQSRQAAQLAGSGGPDASQRWGSGRVQITGLRLLGAEGREQIIFQTGAPLQLEIAYQAAERVEAPVFGLAIHRQDGVHVCGPNTAFAGLDLGHVAGRGTLTYTVPALPLLDGLYQVSVAVVNQNDTQVFDYHDRAYPFRVQNDIAAPHEKYGLVTLHGDWEHHPALPAG